MEKLIVKNFGPIKEAEIDLTKYVVFIGDTSTGKSVLAKLIAIFRDNDLVFSADRINTLKDLLDHYNILFDLEETTLEYYFGIGNKIIFDQANLDLLENGQQLDISLEGNDKESLTKLSYDLNLIVKELNSQNPEMKALAIQAKQILDDLIESNKSLHFTSPVYIPAERILTSIVSSSISGLWANNVSLPNCYKDFAANYDFARKKILSASYPDFSIKYIYKNDVEYISLDSGNLPLSQSSSGIQSLLPLLLVFDYEINHIFTTFNRGFIVEEPELNLFPTKQKLLVEYIIKEISKTDDKLIFTTHSPYILSVLDTLMLAKNTYNEHPDLKDQIAAIVSEDKWIDYNDISVYEVLNDGTIRSIKNEEFKSIDTNAIDGVSDIISEEFDKLTELRYAQ